MSGRVVVLVDMHKNHDGRRRQIYFPRSSNHARNSFLLPQQLNILLLSAQTLHSAPAQLRGGFD